MSYANGTPFLNLAQTVGTDHRDWFDENAAKLDLDTKMKTLWDGASSTADILEQLQETVSDLDTDLAALTTTVDGHTTTLQTVNESLVLINSALTALNTDVHTKYDSAGIADPYDPTYGIYAVGDVVTYNGQRYRCVTAVTAAEPFDADKWLAEDIQTVIDGINSDLGSIENTVSGLSEKTTTRVNLPSGWYSGGGGYVDFFKSGDIVEARVTNLKAGQSGSEVTNLFQIPEGFRPHSDIMWYLISPNDSGVNGRLNMKANGVVDAYFYSSGDVNVNDASITFIHSMN